MKKPPTKSKCVTRAQLVEAIFLAACVSFAIWVLGWLEEKPMPSLGKALTMQRMEDVKFYAPPLAAIAIVVFNAPNLPALKNVLTAIIGSCLAACIVVNIFGPGKFARALACGGAMLFMKATGLVYPPAGALAVLFVDNAKMQEMGLFYSLMPGLTGTLVLILLAAIKIKVLQALKKSVSKCAPDLSDELLSPLLPKV